MKSWKEYFEEDWLDYEEYVEEYNTLNTIIGKNDMENPFQRITLDKDETKAQYEDIFRRLQKFSSVNDYGWVFDANRKPYKEQHNEIKGLINKAIWDEEGFLREITEMNRKYEGEDLYERITIFTPD